MSVTTPELGDVPGVTTHHPGSDAYGRATSPQNSLFTQQPAVVAAPRSADQVAASVRFAREHGLTVVPQATGHGATSDLGPDVLLLDTTGLDRLDVDAASRTVRAGAGLTWGTVNGALEPHGLLGRAGSAPDVGITGYTLGAGAGWLVRPWGLASGALRGVEYVDGRGRVRRASDDADDPLDREVVWACRGGGGVGIVVSLEFDLVPVRALRAGYLLWPVDHLDAVVTAWREALPRVGPSLGTSLALLQAPPGPPIPEQLQGQRVVHLSLAADGEADAEPLWQALRSAPPPVADTWGDADVERLGTIHLDPPVAVPGLGVARWLDDSAPGLAPALFRAVAHTREVAQFELRNVANGALARPGALDRPPGSFMLHAVGSPPEDGDTTALEADLARVVDAAAPADTGLAIGSWSDGRPRVPDGLPADVRRRVQEIADRVDPDHVLARAPLIAEAPAGRHRGTD